jgi:hypothetical protein
MLTRRRFAALSAAGIYTGVTKTRSLASIAGIATRNEDTSSNVSQHVDLRIGTGGHGHCYPGATVPSAWYS